jgi:hypothetical protein
MSEMLSPPADWRPFTLELSPAPSGNGLEGALVITDPSAPDGSRVFRIAGWRCIGDKVEGYITMRGPDPWLDAWLARIASKIQGG